MSPIRCLGVKFLKSYSDSLNTLYLCFYEILSSDTDTLLGEETTVLFLPRVHGRVGSRTTNKETFPHSECIYLYINVLNML